MVDDLDIGWPSFYPAEANPPLVVDPDRMLADTIATQLLQMVRRRRREVVQPLGSIQQPTFPKRDRLDVGRQPS